MPELDLGVPDLDHTEGGAVPELALFGALASDTGGSPRFTQLRHAATPRVCRHPVTALVGIERGFTVQHKRG